MCGVTDAHGARGHVRGTGAGPTHVLVRHDVGDVLQDQLSPLAVLVELLEEDARLEVPSGDRHTWLWLQSQRSLF